MGTLIRRLKAMSLAGRPARGFGAISLPSLIAALALGAAASPAGATVIIKTFHFSICVTGAKTPDACKNAGADAHVVVSDDKMEDLDAKIGDAASIVALPGKGASSPPSRGDRHPHFRQGGGPQQPIF